jgi:hypothetical protein
MKDHFAEERLNRLLPAVPSLADSIGARTVPEEHVLKGILRSIDVEEEGWALEQLVRWTKILQRATIASTDDEKATIAKELQARGIPEDRATAAVDRVCHARAPSPITTEEGRSPEEDIRFEIGRQNFVRAAMLAQQYQRPQDEVRHLQELALKKYAFEYRNYIGLRILMQEYELSEAALERILGKSLKEIGD